MISEVTSQRCYNNIGCLGSKVLVYGDWLPRHLFGGKFTALFAIIRMIYLSIALYFFVLPTVISKGEECEFCSLPLVLCLQLLQLLLVSLFSPLNRQREGRGWERNCHGGIPRWDIGSNSSSENIWLESYLLLPLS